MSFNHFLMHVHTWQPLFSNKVIQVILCLDIRTCLYYVWYSLYHLPPWHPKVLSVSCNNYIFNILYLPLRQQRLIYMGEVLSNVIGLMTIICKKLVTFIQVTVSSSHTPLTAGFLRLSRAFFSVGQFSSFNHKVLIHVAARSYISLVTVAVYWYDELSDTD